MNKLPRAFLSHFSGDKKLVGEVARNLGRAAVIYDDFEFSTGDEFKRAILKGFERSDVFVLFASKQALQRDWVKLEIATAEQAVATQALSRVLTYIIDPDVGVSDIPEWMKETLIARMSEPGLIALDIRRVIGERVARLTPTYFVGRQSELHLALETIASFTDPHFRPPLIVYGLSGIGRRSVVQNIARDNLSYPKLLRVEINSGDLLADLQLKLTVAVSPKSIPDLNAHLKTQSQMSSSALISEILPVLRKVCSTGALPVIIDHGALALSNGALRSEYQELYDAIAKDNATDAMIIANRRLYGSAGESLPSVRVTELSKASAQNLIRIMGRDRGLSFGAEDLASLATYSRGYPPAVRFAIDEVTVRGLPQVISNQRALVNFSAEIFLRQLREDEALTRTKGVILQLLSNYSPLPTGVIAGYCGLDAEALAEEMGYLLDLAFVIPDGPHYRISEPLRDAAYRAYDGVGADHSKVAVLLEKHLQAEPDEDSRIALGQSIFRASLLSGSATSSQFSIGFASDLISIATQSYHDQDYDLAIKYGATALEARPDNIDVRRYVAQALIRKERYSDAEPHVAELIRLGELKEAYYIKGFAARRQRDYSEAIENYRKSMANGRGGVAIHRELASCYFESGQLESAEDHIRKAEAHSPHNRYVVDLRCTIALRLGDLQTAERTIEVLERVDNSGFAEHRRSTFEQAKGNSVAALTLAKQAIEKITRPPFEVYANLVNCQIENGDSAEAINSLTELQQKFGSTHHDAQVGLRCKYEVRFGSTESAQGLWMRIRDKSTPVHHGLRLSILNKKALTVKLTDAEEQERQSLLARLSDAEGQRMTRLLGSIISRSD